MADTQFDSEQELVRQCQAGSLRAFEELVRLYEGRIYRFAMNCCGNREDAREVTQDTFVGAFRAIAQFDTNRPFAPWLFTIARRKCIDHHRSAPPADSKVALDLAEGGDPGEILARSEEGRNLWRLARRRLPEIQYQALWLKYAEDMSVAEIAGVLHRGKVHVKVLLFRARQTLGRTLAHTHLDSQAKSCPKSAGGLDSRFRMKEGSI